MDNSVSGIEKGLYYAIRPVGPFTVKTLRQTRKFVDEAFNAGHLYLVFDLDQCTLVDSSALGLIVNVHKKLSSQGGSAFVVGLPPSAREAAQRTSLQMAVPCCATLNDVEASI